MRAKDDRLGLNLFGYFSANLGLGVAARHYLAAILDAGFDVHAVDVPSPWGRSGHDSRFEGRLHTLDEPAPYDANLVFLNPYSYGYVLGRRPKALRPRRRIEMMLPFWELPVLPESWPPILRRMDAVLAPTDFIRCTLTASIDRTPVRAAPMPYRPEPAVVADRSRFGLPREPVLFVTAFELASDIARKNPFATIDAFRRAFPGRDDVRLLLKLNNSRTRREFHPLRRQLESVVAEDPRMSLLDAAMPYSDVLSLYASADVYVSLHRAEGLGLGMMEAMSLGKPVIATGWSGNLDFMSERNSCLVDYRLVRVVGATHGAYSAKSLAPEARWADPDVDQAADWMRQLADDAELRRRVGDRARRDMENRAVERELAEELRAVLSRLRRRRSRPRSVASPAHVDPRR